MTAPASVFLVLGSASLSGGIVRGLSGFGSAIIHTLVWIICTSAGVDSGSLQLAVAAEAINSVAVSIPLILLTKAWRTAEPTLVISLVGMSAAFSPIGAAMLVSMDVHTVELVMACILVAVIALRLDLHMRAWHLLLRATGRASKSSCGGGGSGGRGSTRSGNAEVGVADGDAAAAPAGGAKYKRPCACGRGCGAGCCCSSDAAAALDDDVEGAWLLSAPGVNSVGSDSSTAVHISGPVLHVGAGDADCGTVDQVWEVAVTGTGTFTGTAGEDALCAPAAVMVVGEQEGQPLLGGLQCASHQLQQQGSSCQGRQQEPYPAEQQHLQQPQQPQQHLRQRQQGQGHLPRHDQRKVEPSGLGLECTAACTAPLQEADEQLAVPLLAAAARSATSTSSSSASSVVSIGESGAAGGSDCGAGNSTFVRASGRYACSCDAGKCLCSSGGGCTGACKADAFPAQDPIVSAPGAWHRPLAPLAGDDAAAAQEPAVSARLLALAGGEAAAAQDAALSARPLSSWAGGDAAAAQEPAVSARPLSSVAGGDAGAAHDPTMSSRQLGSSAGGDAAELGAGRGSKSTAGCGLVVREAAVTGGAMAVAPVPCSGDAEAVPLTAVPMPDAAQLTEAVPPARAVLLAEPAATLKASDSCADASFPPASSGPAGDEAGTAEGRGPSWGQRLRSWWATAASLRSAEGRRRFWRDPANRHAMTLLGWGSLAGAACGVMAGLTGMGGPPMMLLYHCLNIDKMAVRGTNAWGAMVQPRIIAYATMGVIHASDWQLYLACSLIHMVGIVLGDRAVRFVNQRTFSHILLMLMLVCVALLFCAAFQVGHGGGSGGGGGEGGEAGADTDLSSSA